MIHGIKGVKDILPDEIRRWQAIEAAARRTASLYGFHEIRIPIFEVTELFARSIGASTDIVEKEMYTFQDRDGTSLTLRPEATAGAVRAYIEHSLGSMPGAQKLYYLGPMFRHERPQAGRLRQFHQFGVESFGSPSPYADVEVMSLLWRFLNGLGLTELTFEVNSLGDATDRPAYKAVLVEFLKTCEDRLCGNCRRRMETNPLRVLDCKVPECRAATEEAPRLTDHLSPSAREHFARVTEGLSMLGVPFVLNPRLVRGLDYYTLTTFEVTGGRLGAQNAVGAGGRYDGLVKALGGSETPAVGFAVGLERVALLLPEAGLPPAEPLICVAAFGSAGVPVGVRVLDDLRRAGLRADADLRTASLKAQLRHADRLGALLVAIIGDDEVAKGVVLLRDMRSKAQEEVPLSGVVARVSARLHSPAE
jgi:histidyl-tRNA synthetase